MRVLVIALALVAMGFVGEPAALAQPHHQHKELLEKLTPQQRQVYEAYAKARAQFERKFKAYWSAVETKRAARRAKYRAGQPYHAEDYIPEQPPKYTGPELPADILKVIAGLKTPPDSKPESPALPTVADMLRHAKEQYGFVPTAISEAEFKRRYAREALKVGLTKEQVVRVYALETGGLGTYDMQSGFNPVTRQGRPISSALGYAQLLHANSTSELVRHGPEFVKRLTAMAQAPGLDAARAKDLREKARILSRMMVAARTIPNEWYAHVRFGKTPHGLGIHTLNLDGDVGPWLQVLKLKGLKDDAEKAGRGALNGAELEIMNLSGPRTGLEMMTPLAQPMPTSNFFSEGGYYRNGVVRERTAAELMKALEQRMDANVKRAGAVEFAAIFDEVAAGR